MKTLLVLMVSGWLLAGGLLAGGDDAVKKDLKLLEGDWKIASFENAKGTDEGFKGAVVVFKGDMMQYTKDGETKKGKYKINPAGKPKEIDVTPEGKDEAMSGIYQIDGKTLKLCLCDNPSAARPTTFEAKDNNILIVLKKD